MTDPNRTHITAVLDRSGSMQCLTAETVSGFNKFVADQKAVPGTANLTLVLFNTDYKVVHDAVDIQKVPDLTAEVYNANGYTALYDALAEAIKKTGEALEKLPETERPGVVIVLVMTDGAENSSKEYGGQRGLAALQAMVKHQTEKYSWKFVFMGANIDAKAVGSSLGVQQDWAMNYKSDSAGTYEAYAVMSNGTRGLREFSSRGGDLKSAKFFEDPDKLLDGKDKGNKN
jgi:uncharacterized protein YegL